MGPLQTEKTRRPNSAPGGVVSQEYVSVTERASSAPAAIETTEAYKMASDALARIIQIRRERQHTGTESAGNKSRDELARIIKGRGAKNRGGTQSSSAIYDNTESASGTTGTTKSGKAKRKLPRKPLVGDSSKADSSKKTSSEGGASKKTLPTPPSKRDSSKRDSSQQNSPYAYPKKPVRKRASTEITIPNITITEEEREVETESYGTAPKLEPRQYKSASLTANLSATKINNLTESISKIINGDENGDEKDKFKNFENALFAVRDIDPNKALFSNNISNALKPLSFEDLQNLQIKILESEYKLSIELSPFSEALGDEIKEKSNSHFNPADQNDEIVAALCDAFEQYDLNSVDEEVENKDLEEEFERLIWHLAMYDDNDEVLKRVFDNSKEGENRKKTIHSALKKNATNHHNLLKMLGGIEKNDTPPPPPQRPSSLPSFLRSTESTPADPIYSGVSDEQNSSPAQHNAYAMPDDELQTASLPEDQSRTRPLSIFSKLVNAVKNLFKRITGSAQRNDSSASEVTQTSTGPENVATNAAAVNTATVTRTKTRRPRGFSGTRNRNRVSPTSPSTPSSSDEAEEGVPNAATASSMARTLSTRVTTNSK